MNVYPIGNNLTVKWTLRYSDGTVFPLSLYDYDLSYRTSRGVKVATDTTVEDNVLRWMLKADDQVVSGPYSLALKISFAGNKAVDLQYNNAFALTSLSHGNGANVEVCIESNCDMIDLKDAVLQARKAMDMAQAAKDIAGSAVNTADGAEATANEAKTIASTANNTSIEAKTIANNAKTGAEKAATDASRDAAAAQQAAQTASDHITSLQQAIAGLPDGQAVTEKVAEHTIKLTELKSQIGTQKGLSTDIDIDNLPNGIVSFTATSVPVGLPNIDYGAGATIITTKKSNENLSNYDRQVLITKQYICTRPYYNGWQEWEKSQVANIQLGLISSIDIDNLPNGTLSFTATSVPVGLPNIDYGAGALLVTMRNNSLKNLDRQFIITTKSISTRPYYNGWQKWETTDIDAGGKFLQKGLSSDIDVDNLANGIVSFTSTSVPSGMPNIDYGAGATIVTIRATQNTFSDFDRQIIITPKTFATRAYYKEIWQEWETYNYQDNIIHCGQGQKYTRLRDAVAAAIEVENTKVVIHPGTYNLAEEFAEEIANQNGTGIVLHNGVHLLFMSGSYVTCEIDVSNEWAYSNFEPFSAYKDFTLENAHIICRNTRYCVHDELNGASTYHHRYINCHMEYINEHESANFTQCIGGGMGEHGYIEIIGGYYKSSSKYYQDHYNSTDDMQQPISFHNGISNTCDGKIVIKDVYLADKGYFRFGMYGGSTKKTPIYISGCRMYKAPFLMNEQWNDSQIQNMEVIAWNNEIVV